MVRRPGAVVRPADLLRRPWPVPPERLRRGPFRPGAFGSPLRSRRLTAHLGLALGVAFTICFTTGLISHFIQHPAWWFRWPSRPVNLYRITQGLHVATGLVAIPLLLAKLWSVYHRLFEWPPVRNLAHAVERLSITVLVVAALVQLTTGLLNIARWYTPMKFFFTVTHYWTGWIVIGALVVHLGVKLPLIVAALRRRTAPPSDVDRQRRGLLAAVAATAGLITVVTVGQTVRPLARLALLGPRRPDIGAQGLPVNKAASAAGVTETARDPAYRLVVEGPERRIALTLDELAELPQHTVTLPITCVEGWSASAEWTGVRVRDLLDLVGAPASADVRVESLETGGLYRTSMLAPSHSRDRLTLLALRLRGERLALDHGYPCRLIAPNRPGVLQTKWVAKVVVLS